MTIKLLYTLCAKDQVKETHEYAPCLNEVVKRPNISINQTKIKIKKPSLLITLLNIEVAATVTNSIQQNINI